MNGGPGKELGAQRAEQFPHLGNYTLTPGYNNDFTSCLWASGYISLFSYSMMFKAANFENSGSAHVLYVYR